jgi:gliding motility-associated-like protein
MLIQALPALAQKTCSITVSSYKGCIPHPVNFDVTTSGGTPVQYNWDFGDGSPGGTTKDPGHVYTQRGSFTVKVIVTFSDGSTCTEVHPKPVRIFDNPKADFNVKQNAVIILCGPSDKICFHDLTSPGLDGAPINGWIWDFGDGGLSTDKTPCYSYSNSGTYVVSLEASDTNGCKKLVQKTIQVKYASQMSLIPQVKFIAGIKYDCAQQKAQVFFTNKTDTVGYGITKFYWDFGDGNKVNCDLTVPSCLSEWLTQKHDYTSSGVFSPTLTVETRYGCKASYVIDTSITLEPYILKIKISPHDTLCHGQDSVIQFEATPSSKASYYIWDYGDPYEPDVGRLPFAQHTYKHPGTYTIRFRTKVNGCIYDTTFCHKITMLGPRAFIHRYSYIYEPWDSIPYKGTGIIPPDRYRYYFDTSCDASGYVLYYRYDTTVVKNGDTVFTYCGAPVTGYKSDSIYDECKKDTFVRKTPVYQPKVAKVKDKIVVTGKPAFWSQGDPWPKGPVYSNPPFVNDPLKMDDTSLFSCGPPKRIKFTNFTTKFRGHDAVDDVPPGFPDTCINPAYPYASDSLEYEWDFGEGDPVTSTKKNRNEKARFSTEKLPTHLYTRAGCYWVKLTAYDPVTRCFNSTQIPVVVEQPNAGWDPSYGNKMTWLEQESLPPNSPPRGMRIIGLPCKDAIQGIDYGETKPYCYKHDYALILDSARQVDPSLCDTNKVIHHWYSKDDINKKLGFKAQYHDTGWITLGVVVSNNRDCSDTVWYHNYKYIQGIFPGVVLDKKQICIGGKVHVTPQLQEQVGIKLFTLVYIVEADKNDIIQVKRDTFHFQVIGAKQDTATSTVHQPDWGIDDPAGLNFNYLRDTLGMVIDTPGHVTLMSYALSRFGCLDSSSVEFTVGHYAEMYTPQTFLCLGDTAKFEGYATYFLPFSVNATGYDTTKYWADPVGVRKGRKPAIPEKMEWDMDGDGITDTTGVNPSYVYKKPGVYTVTLTTTDSSGCRQVIRQKNLMNILGIHAQFGIDSPGSIRYCAPHFYQFRDSSYVVDTAKKANSIESWTWDFGDGTPPIVISDPARRSAGHLYIHNGTFTVTLTVKTFDGTGSDQLGCSEKYSRTIRIIGPNADFTPITPIEGCVPFTVLMRDKSGKTAVHEWKLGDGTQISTKGEDTVYLTYKRPGIFCPQLIVADTIVDFFGRVLYCSDSSQYCKYRIIVHDTSRIALKLTDTVICVNEELLGVQAAPDTGYTSWKVEYGDNKSDTFKKPYFGHTYTDTGHFKIRMTGKNGYCPDTGYAKVHVIDVLSDFYLDSTARDTPYFTFINTSRGAVKYKWEFDDGSPPLEVNDKSPVRHELLKPGKVKICLTAYNKKGCKQTTCKEVEIITDLIIYNVFTPGAKDGRNDHFVIDIKGETKYDLVIYNRWGEQVFESKDKNYTWDGTDQRTGAVLPTGTYYFIFRYRHIGGKDKEAHGTVTLLR